mmetsp:Transcript_13367/g.14805  ORF Transcript_13367/g.14805 Transcript_13367/m.14805 type:complete len:125 (+) Transcript_13367:378-752(+)
MCPLNSMSNKSTIRNNKLEDDLSDFIHNSEQICTLNPLSYKLDEIEAVTRAHIAEFQRKLDAAMKVQIENQKGMENQIAEFKREIHEMHREWLGKIKVQGYIVITVMCCLAVFVYQIIVKTGVN